MIFDFFKIDICLTCKLAILKALFRKKTILFLLAFMVIIFILISNKTLDNENQIFRSRLVRFPNKHKLGIIVPFRNRFNQLIELVPYLNQFLNKQRVNHQFLIMNQVDNYRFNRASLINVGFKIGQNLDCDYNAIHDVDLLPISDQIKYFYPKIGSLMHLTAPGLHPKYKYETFLGGIVLITKEDFEKVNGMSNKYWGWGLEDDEFYHRVKRHNIKIKRPELNNENKNAFIHLHGSSDKRDTAKLYNQKEVTRKADHETGLHNVKYLIEKSKKLIIDNSDVAMIYNIKLECNKNYTPWCDRSIQKIKINKN